MRLVHLKIPNWINFHQASPRSRQPTQSPPIRLPFTRDGLGGSSHFGRSGFQRPVWHQYPDNFSNRYEDSPPGGYRDSPMGSPRRLFDLPLFGGQRGFDGGQRGFESGQRRRVVTEPSVLTVEKLIRDWKLFGLN